MGLNSGIIVMVANPERHRLLRSPSRRDKRRTHGQWFSSRFSNPFKISKPVVIFHSQGTERKTDRRTSNMVERFSKDKSERFSP